MSAISLAPVDWTIILLYFAFVVGLGVYLKRFTATGDDFFLAGRRNSSWVAGLAFLSANLGTLEILGWTGGTMKYGMLVSHFYWVGAIPAMLFLGLYMMPFYYSSRIHSVPGYLRLRYDERTRVLNAFSFAVMTLLMSGINLYLMALVMRTILGWDWHVSMWTSAVAVGSYIALGGLQSAIFTEIIQFFLIWFGLVLVSLLGAVEAGGFHQVFASVPRAMASLWSTTAAAGDNPMGVTWAGVVMGLGWVLSFGYWTTDFLVVQRAFSSRDLRSARLTPINASFFKMALPFIIVVAGLVAHRLAADPASGFELLSHPQTGEPWNDTALPLLIARYYPPGLVGLGITALLAGFMAGQAGNISAFNTVWTYDIYRVVLERRASARARRRSQRDSVSWRAVAAASDRHLVSMGRRVTVVGIVLSVGTAYLAMQFNTIMDYIQAIFSWVNAPLFATMLLGMFWKRTTAAGGFWGLIAGMLSSFSIFLGFKLGLFSPAVARLLTFSEQPSAMSCNLWQAVWSWGVCFTLTAAISLVTRPRPERDLGGLVRGLTERTAGSAAGPNVGVLGQPTTWAVVAFAALVGLNAMFF